MPDSLDGTSINPRLQIVSSTLGSRSKRTWIARRTSATVSMPVNRKVSREKVPTPISQSMKTNKISSAGIHAKIARILEFLRIWNTLRRLITSEVSGVGISSLGGEDVFLLMATFIEEAFGKAPSINGTNQDQASSLNVRRGSSTPPLCDIVLLEKACFQVSRSRIAEPSSTDKTNPLLPSPTAGGSLPASRNMAVTRLHDSN